jgi:hypothetical protein
MELKRKGDPNMACDVVIKDGRIYDGSIPASSAVECWETEASERIFEFLV